MGLNNITTGTGAAEFTDIELDSVSLPSGYEIGEDAGDLVVRDTNGSVALRRVDGGNWSFETNTVEAGQLGTASNPTDVEASNLNAQSVSAGELTNNSVLDNETTQHISALTANSHGFTGKVQHTPDIPQNTATDILNLRVGRLNRMIYALVCGEDANDRFLDVVVLSAAGVTITTLHSVTRGTFSASRNYSVDATNNFQVSINRSDVSIVVRTIGLSPQF